MPTTMISSQLRMHIYLQEFLVIPFRRSPIYYQLPLAFHLIFLVNDEFDSHSPLFLAANWHYIENMDNNHS